MTNRYLHFFTFKPMVMKTQLTRLAGVLFLFSMISCEKSTDVDVDALTMELESCKPDKKKLKVGMEYQGGIIFYLDETGRHGLIAAKEDVGPAPWGCYGTSIPEVSSAPDSKTASKILLANCKEPGIAARLCAKYEVREKGENRRVYKDWYMAGTNELSSIMKAIGSNSNMCGKSYWILGEISSWQGDSRNPANWSLKLSMYCQTNPDGSFLWTYYPNAARKNATGYARPIRDF